MDHCESLEKIDNESFKDAQSLTKIWIANSKLPNASNFGRLEKLKYLTLIDDGIENITKEFFIGIEGLVGLYLAHNEIKVLHKHVFANLKNLQELDLSHNQLQVFNLYLHLNMELKILVANDNKISSVIPLLFSNIQSLKYVNLENNVCVNRTFNASTKNSTQLTKCYQPYSSYLLSIIEDNSDKITTIEEKILKSESKADENLKNSIESLKYLMQELSRQVKEKQKSLEEEISVGNSNVDQWRGTFEAQLNQMNLEKQEEAKKIVEIQSNLENFKGEIEALMMKFEETKKFETVDEYFNETLIELNGKFQNFANLFETLSSNLKDLEEDFKRKIEETSDKHEQNHENSKNSLVELRSELQGLKQLLVESQNETHLDTNEKFQNFESKYDKLNQKYINLYEIIGILKDNATNIEHTLDEFSQSADGNLRNIDQTLLDFRKDLNNLKSKHSELNEILYKNVSHNEMKFEQKFEELLEHMEALKQNRSELTLQVLSSKSEQKYTIGNVEMSLIDFLQFAFIAILCLFILTIMMSMVCCKRKTSYRLKPDVEAKNSNGIILEDFDRYS